MKLEMKREALEADCPGYEMAVGEAQTAPVFSGFGTVLVQ
jgi:hypothetical protein